LTSPNNQQQRDNNNNNNNNKIIIIIIMSSAKNANANANTSGNNFEFDGQSYCVVIEPTKEEVIKELDSHKYGKVDEKKAKLELLINKKDELQTIFSGVSDALSCNLEKALPDMKMLKNRNLFKGHQVAETIYEVSVVYTSFDSQARVSQGFRRHQDHLWKLLEELKDLVEEANDASKTKKLMETKKYLIKLPRIHKERRFKVRGKIPDDEAFRICIVCGHNAVDEPDTNKDAFKRNQKKLDEHAEKKREIEDAKSHGDLVRAPPPPKNLDPIFRKCHCHHMKCMRGSNKECPNPACTGEPDTFDADGVCIVCPICACPCPAAWEVSKMNLMLDFLVFATSLHVRFFS
jgi:hypothetical protein